nr:hypothetical protein [Tanacetum cinerariifolium]
SVLLSAQLIFPYVEANPLNPPPPASDSETDDVFEVEDMVEHEGEIVPNSFLEDMVREFGNVEERAECKKLKKELEEEMSRRGVLFEERPNEAIDVPVKDEESPSSKPWGS